MSAGKWWKSYPYWLKGGLITSLAITLILILSLAATLANFPLEIPINLLTLPLTLVTSLLSSLFGKNNSALFKESAQPQPSLDPTLLTLAIIAALIILLFFLFGALIGFLFKIGKGDWPRFFDTGSK